jgi:hypothetical protein
MYQQFTVLYVHSAQFYSKKEFNSQITVFTVPILEHAQKYITGLFLIFNIKIWHYFLLYYYTRNLSIILPDVILSDKLLKFQK